MSQHFNHPSYEALYQACGRSGSGDDMEVKRILDEDPSLLNKVLNSAGSTVLIYASIYNHIKIIKYLLTLDQLNINQQNHRGRTALHCASYYGYKEIVKLLLTHSDIDIHTRDKDGKLATDICCDNTSNMSNKPIILDLLNNHGDIKASPSSLSLSSTTITTALTQYLSERSSSSYERSSTISHEDSFHQPRKYSEEVESTKIIEEVKEKELPRVDEEKESLKLQIVALENIVKEMEDQIKEKEKECMELRDQVLAMGSSYETQLKQMESSNKELEKKLEKKERALQWSLGRVGKVLSLPLPPNKQTHVFLTHTWRDDEKGRNNHDRVGRVNQAIRERGLVIWFDSERMSGTVRQAMTNALDATCCVLIFITKKYEEKVNSANEGDNCYFEFNVAAHDKNLANMRIPIVMEECMLSQEGWRGRLKAEVGHQLYFDLSSSDEEGVLEKQYDKIVERVVELLKERFPEVSFDNNLQTSTRKASRRLKSSEMDHRNDSNGLKGSPVLFPFVQWYESLRLNEKIMFFIMIFLLSLILVSNIYQRLSSFIK